MLDGDKWSVAYVPPGVTRHNSSQVRVCVWVGVVRVTCGRKIKQHNDVAVFCSCYF